MKLTIDLRIKLLLFVFFEIYDCRHKYISRLTGFSKDMSALLTSNMVQGGVQHAYVTETERLSRL